MVLGNLGCQLNVTILEIVVKYPFISSHSNNYFDSEYIYIYIYIIEYMPIQYWVTQQKNHKSCVQAYVKGTHIAELKHAFH